MEFKSNQTIASQIADFVKREIFSGRYEPGQKVPPIREFAAFCCVNPNTVVKVYAQLEAERLIYTDSTLGKFVNPDRGGRSPRSGRSTSCVGRGNFGRNWSGAASAGTSS